VIINAITAYYNVKKEIFFRRSRSNRLKEDNVSTIIKIKKPILSESENLLNQTIRSIRTNKKFIIYFFYFGNPNLSINKRIFPFSLFGCLTKHFLKKYIKKMKPDQNINCEFYDVRFVHRMYLQKYVKKFHGTISRAYI
jgi:hypothetical protein